MKKGQHLWTREELILAINLYCKLPFGRLHSRNPEIIELARLIDRSPSALAFKLVNFASLDPSLLERGIKGAANVSKLDKEIWQEFYRHWDILIFESEKLLAKYKNTTVEQLYPVSEEESFAEGNTREQMVKLRINQSVFRSTILAAYNNSCCITGINETALLVAGHIRPWAEDVKNRLNPRNGIALNALHDKAFEAGFITITTDYRIKISPKIMKQQIWYSQDLFGKYEDKQIILPSRFLPDTEFLKYHNEERFIS
jgi:putative restriction endonuclease